jgi:hypothetical protein
MILITKWLRLSAAIGLPWAQFIMPSAEGQYEDAMQGQCKTAWTTLNRE